MSNSKFKIHYVYNSKEQHVKLGYAEIQTLLFLNEHSFLSQPQLYDFFCFANLIHPASFRKKTSGWVEAGIIKKKPLRLQNGHSVVIISLTSSGVNILKKLGYVKQTSTFKALRLNSSTIDHALAIRQVVLDVIALHRKQTRAQLYLVKGQYFIGIQPDVFFKELSGTVVIYKSQRQGSDNLGNFKPYNSVTGYKDTLLTSINPYNEPNTEVIADWLFEYKGHFLHIEVDSGFEQIRKSKNLQDTSFEGKLSRLQPQLQKNKIDPSRYHVLFVMINNREDAILTKNHPSRATRVANVKQEIARFSDFDQWQYEMNVIQFSRVPYFLKDFFRKITELLEDERLILCSILDAFVEKKQLQFAEWELDCIDKDAIIENKIFHQDGYIPEMAYFFEHRSNFAKQFIIPFIINEGDIKSAEQLAIIAARLNKGAYSGLLTKILVIYPTIDQLRNDILRKTTSKSKDPFAMDTSKMLFISVENFTHKYDTPKLFNDNKKQIGYASIFAENIPNK